MLSSWASFTLPLLPSPSQVGFNATSKLFVPTHMAQQVLTGILRAAIQILGCTIAHLSLWEPEWLIQLQLQAPNPAFMLAALNHSCCSFRS